MRGAARRDRPRRRHATGGRGRGRGAGAESRRPIRPGPGEPRLCSQYGVPRVRVCGWRMPVPGNGGDVAGRGGGARPGVAAQRPRPVGRASVARAGPALGVRPAAAARARDSDRADPDTARARERDAGARGVRRLDQPAVAHSRDRACRGAAAAHGGRLDPRESRHAAPGRCPPQRPAWPSDRAGLHGRRGARGDAAPAPYGPAARRCADGDGRHPRRDPRLVGGERPAPRSAGTARRRRSGRSRRRHHGSRRRALYSRSGTWRPTGR